NAVSIPMIVAAAPTQPTADSVPRSGPTSRITPTPSAPIHSPWSARPADHGASKASSPDPQKTPKPKPAAINAPAPSTLRGFLQLGDDPADRFLRVAEQHPRLGIEIQLVVDAGEARLH